ncbi:UDP-N-acetylmuramoyl-L-alanine--D-glutamate ligase [Aerolutibacter ruishenii]|uniref:UDP-N-acetylmuramoyl-L-alanine--L-glutamate ligase n=1 Tax=Aerolutibacter ruishenii TaxID=686800 RepID=A0A562LPL0_9GAMM|nr:UDP-N-acetylmuramoyl-L-alanine--D-glutamate ligase [Lysobacter ruishenii]TWI09523.1 UDP-N-acetylmuramoylalanine--D-glutamate ligase [Lysobacter ruishenii]
MRISQLDGQRVALWGWGREGHSAYRALRGRLPHLPLTLFCADEEVANAQALGDPRLAVETAATAERLSAFDVVVKSPGISPYKPEAVAARARGTRFIGGTALWFAEHAGPDGIVTNTVCVTGTKGKSTTTSLLAHLLRAGGHVTALAGNIGLPLLELPESPVPAYRAIELSSYQTGDVADSGARPDVAVVLNIFPEHLDWHGGEARYVEDKLRLLTGARPRIAIINANDPHLAGLSLPDSDVRCFGHAEGWHLREDVLYRGDRQVMDTAALPLPGRHNRGNLCAVLAAIEALGLDAVALAPHAADFKPLPHRLQTLGVRDGLTWVNDSISTTPFASLAALDCFRSRRVAILVGGHDRGVDWHAFAEAMRHGAPQAIVTMGQNGPRIHELLAPLSGEGRFALSAADDLAMAITQARTVLGNDGVLLLSPGAPSFGPYRDYVARGRHFAQLGGFDPDSISTIPGLGIA